MLTSALGAVFSLPGSALEALPLLNLVGVHRQRVFYDWRTPVVVVSNFLIISILLSLATLGRSAN